MSKEVVHELLHTTPQNWLIYKSYNFIGMLFNMRSQNMNSLATLNSVLLRKGGLDKEAFAQLRSSCFVVSYNKTIDDQLKLAVGHDKLVKIWSGLETEVIKTRFKLRDRTL